MSQELPCKCRSGVRIEDLDEELAFRLDFDRDFIGEGASLWGFNGGELLLKVEKERRFEEGGRVLGIRP